MEMTPEIHQRITALAEKYNVMGQDMLSYLDGLLHADYLTYWDYIHLDTLLSLQTPRTPFPDEYIFITYHQITELYFKLCLQAFEQLRQPPVPELTLFKRQVGRVNRYFDNLIHSFDVMIEGMDRQEFLQYRMSLLPASGFQSVQYRMIEIVSTDFIRLLHPDHRAAYNADSGIAEMYEHLYWRRGNLELATGQATLTLRQFELKYNERLVRLGEHMRYRNLWQLYRRLPAADQQDEELIRLLKTHDFNVCVKWRLAHYRSAARYLDRQPKVIEATGGTNWQQYLPPRFQRISFYPDLWTEEERADWGMRVKAFLVG